MDGAKLIWEHSEPTFMPITPALTAEDLKNLNAKARALEQKEKDAAEKAEQAEKTPASKLGGLLSAIKKGATDAVNEVAKSMGVEVQIKEEAEVIVVDEADADPVAAGKKIEEKPTVLYANDDKLEEMTMVIIGTSGNQHRVLQFADGIEPKKKNQKPGNCTINLSQNSYLRGANAETFVLLTTTKGETSAKPLTPAGEASDKLPTIILHGADVDFTKDCWLEIGHDDEIEAIQTIAKSSTDEYLNVSSIDLTTFDGSSKKLKMKTCKLKGQELMMAYPCVASNVGCRLINIQSIV